MTTKAKTGLDEWRGRAIHTVTLPSGMVVKIRIPNLGQLLKGDAIPDRLRSVAISQVARELDPSAAPLFQPDDQQSPEQKIKVITEVYELYEWLVTETVIEPAIGENDLDGLPEMDKQMLAQIAGRERDTDALGVTLGVEPLSRWETFLREHGCTKDCPACQKVVGIFSTARPGLV
jgi:hypothetical protein